MRNFLFIGLTAFAIGCANNKSHSVIPPETEVASEVTEEEVSIETEDSENSGKPQRPYQVKGILGDVSSKKSDEFEILSARLNGDKLSVHIKYTGGCAHHKFECIGSRSISKSLPPQRSIKIIHDNDNDSCESLVMQTLEIDLRAFALSEEKNGTITLNLEGMKGQLNYSY